MTKKAIHDRLVALEARAHEARASLSAELNKPAAIAALAALMHRASVRNLGRLVDADEAAENLAGWVEYLSGRWGLGMLSYHMAPLPTDFYTGPLLTEGDTSADFAASP